LDDDRFCFDENFNAMSLADPQLTASDRKQSSIFTHSGNNFVFGNIMAPPEAEAKNVRSRLGGRGQTDSFFFSECV
jgi:hypothetical protein